MTNKGTLPNKKQLGLNILKYWKEIREDLSKSLRCQPVQGNEMFSFAKHFSPFSSTLPKNYFPSPNIFLFFLLHSFSCPNTYKKSKIPRSESRINLWTIWSFYKGASLREIQGLHQDLRCLPGLGVWRGVPRPTYWQDPQKVFWTASLKPRQSLSSICF